MKQSRIKSGKLAIAVTALLMLQGFVSFSQTNIKLAQYKPGTAKLQINTPASAEAVTVSVKDESGVTLYSERYKADQYTKLITFSKLNNGKYFIDLEQSKGVTRKVLVKDSNGLSIQEADLYFRNVIKFEDDDKKLLVRFNSNLNESVTLRIADSAGNIVHEVNNITSEAFVSKFNLSALNHGNYKVSIISDAYSSYRNIQL